MLQMDAKYKTNFLNVCYGTKTMLKDKQLLTEDC